LINQFKKSGKRKRKKTRKKKDAIFFKGGSGFLFFLSAKRQKDQENQKTLPRKRSGKMEGKTRQQNFSNFSIKSYFIIPLLKLVFPNFYSFFIYFSFIFHLFRSQIKIDCLFYKNKYNLGDVVCDMINMMKRL